MGNQPWYDLCSRIGNQLLSQCRLRYVLSFNDMYPDPFLFKAPANGIGMKIWTCIANLAAQTWTYGSDNKIVLSVQGTQYQFSL